jgi:Tfp pilus assembly protein PilX
MTCNQDRSKPSERGIALISALMVMTILLALGIAVVYSTTVDTVVTKSQRVGEESFFAADAGVGIARRALAQAVSEEIDKIRTGVNSM